MRQDCLDCQRLWREYAAATTAHIGQESRLRLLAPGSASAQALAKDVAVAATVRETARQAIQRHETTVHGDTPEAADIDG